MNIQGVFSTQIALDNDSGYVSHYQESNSSYLSDFTNETISNMKIVNSVYINEDALLEQPITSNKFNQIQNVHESSYTDSEVLEASVKTMSSTYSGLQTDSSTEKSVVIETISPIIVREEKSRTISTSTQDSFLNCSTDMSFDTNSIDFEDSCDFKNRKFMEDQRALTRRMSAALPSISKTPNKKYSNSINPNFSPDLFSDEENLEELNTSTSQLNPVLKEQYIHKNDSLLIKKAQKSLSGLLPPPSLKVVNFTVEEMLNKLETNKHLFITKNNSNDSSSLLLTTNYEKMQQLTWPNILEERYHGLHYNSSKLSEKFEDLCTKYSLKYVGGETQSSCTIFEINQSSPSKRKSTKLRWNAKSPGRRLSHLARRRITFSSSNLQNNLVATSSHSRQILIDAKKIQLLSRKKSPRKTPRKSPRKTPRKSPKKQIKTPSSSTKKFKSTLQMFQDNHNISGPSTSLVRASATKRALFQSPEKDKFDAKQLLFPSVSKSGRSPFKKITPKRALFTSPAKKSPNKCSKEDNNKRKRTDTDDMKPAKLARSISMVDGKIQNENLYANITRTHSDTSLSVRSFHGYAGELSAHHKKKLQWAVYEALRSQKIGINHPKFKAYASTLARVTRRFLPNLSANAPRPEGGTSERMLRIARQHVFAVTRGKTVDEIVQTVLENKMKIPIKPTGYIGLDTENDKNIKNKENIFHDKSNIICNNSNDKFNISKNSVDTSNNILKKNENRIERVRKVINFDSDNKR